MSGVPGIPLAQRRFPARAIHLAEVRDLVREICVSVGCGEACSRDIVLAVDEACQNIIRHAYARSIGDLVVELRKDGDRLVVRLIDFAPPIDVDKIKPRPLEDIRPGGLGTHFIREVMDEVAFLPPPQGAGNLLQLIKRIG